MIPLLDKPGLQEPPEGALPSMEDGLRIIMNDSILSVAKHVTSWCKVSSSTGMAACQVIMVTLNCVN